MFFLLRMTFWLGLVLILLPTGAAQHNSAGSGINTSEAISAASATVGDVRGFCARQPEACSVGSQVAIALGYRAQAGAKMLYDVLSEAVAPRETGSLPSAGSRHSAGAKTAVEKPAGPQTSQNTLTPTDLVPSWRGPAPRKDAKHSTQPAA